MKHLLLLTWKDIRHKNAGGAEQVMHEYAKQIVKKGIRVTQLASKCEGLPEKELIDGIEIIRIATNHTIWMFSGIWYKKYFKSDKPDYIIDQAGGWPMMAPFFSGSPRFGFFVHHVGDDEFNAYIKPIGYLAKQLYLWMFRQYKNCLTFTVSQSTKDDLVEKFGYSPNNIVVLENVLETPPQFEDIPQKAETSPIIFLGRLTHIKRAEDAIDAFIIASKEMPNEVELHIYGPEQDKTYAAMLRNKAHDSGISTRIHFKGKINQREREEAFRKAKALIVPSKKEGFGLVVLEANAFGVPAIVYDVAGLRDSVHHGLNGVICKDGSTQELATQLARCYLDKNWYTELVATTKTDYTSRPTWEDQTNNLLKYIEKTDSSNN